jgi:uroporphyrin-III C-methyltransferase/precorrin-2 dehydrogenase/sirohydrochlorin ferrochelatase
MTWHSLPLFVTVAGRPVILLGDGEAADAKRRLLERAGAVVVGEDTAAALAIVALDDEAAALAAVTRLKARGVLVNAVDRPALCDFTVPAIIDRDPVLVAIGTGGASAGLAAALRQRLEAMLPPSVGPLARALHAARAVIRTRFPDGIARRRAIGAALAPGGQLDPLAADHDVDAWLAGATGAAGDALIVIRPRSADPDDLTLREARLLSQADRILHSAAVPTTLLDRARADAMRIVCDAPPATVSPGLTLYMEMA